MTKKIILNIILALFFIFSLATFSNSQEKLFKKINVKKEEAPDEVRRAIFSIGISAPAIGNDPCQGTGKTTGGIKKYNPESFSLGKLPSKPTISDGRQGQIMEGEGSSYSAENICYEGSDPQGNKCSEAIANPDGTTTFKNTSEDKCVVVINEKQTVSLAPNSEITINTEKKESNPVLEGLGKAWSWLRKDLPDWAKSSKGSVTGVRGNCDPEGIAGGCRVNAGYGVVHKTLPEYLNAMAEDEKKGLAKRLRWDRVNPSPESAGSLEGPKPTETYPNKSTKSGYEKEKSSKVDKGVTIINPSDSDSGRGGSSIDFCGRHLPTPEQAAAMGFDPGKITDPANRDWTGRIEQRRTERTLTWSKTIYSYKGSVKVEYTYKEGEVVSINYEFFDQKGNKIGYAVYDSRNRTVEAKRLK